MARIAEGDCKATSTDLKALDTYAPDGSTAESDLLDRVHIHTDAVTTAPAVTTVPAVNTGPAVTNRD